MFTECKTKKQKWIKLKINRPARTHQHTCTAFAWFLSFSVCWFLFLKSLFNLQFNVAIFPLNFNGGSFRFVSFRVYAMYVFYIWTSYYEVCLWECIMWCFQAKKKGTRARAKCRWVITFIEYIWTHAKITHTHTHTQPNHVHGAETKI